MNRVSYYVSHSLTLETPIGIGIMAHGPDRAQKKDRPSFRFYRQADKTGYPTADGGVVVRYTPLLWPIKVISHMATN